MASEDSELEEGGCCKLPAHQLRRFAIAACRPDANYFHAPFQVKLQSQQTLRLHRHRVSLTHRGMRQARGVAAAVTANVRGCLPMARSNNPCLPLTHGLWALCLFMSQPRVQARGTGMVKVAATSCS